MSGFSLSHQLISISRKEFTQSRIGWTWKMTFMTSFNSRCGVCVVGGGFKQSHLARVPQIRVWGWVRAHTYGALGDKCTRGKPAWHVSVYLSIYHRGVKLKARGPDPARHLILCGPRELAKNIISLSYKSVPDWPSGEPRLFMVAWPSNFNKFAHIGT